MANLLPYASWLNLCAEARKEASDPDFYGCEEILAYIYLGDSEGKSVKVTDLVQSLLFGTGPTVHRKLRLLSDRGLVRVSSNKNDGRAKKLTLTKSGSSLLGERSQQLMNAITT